MVPFDNNTFPTMQVVIGNWATMSHVGSLLQKGLSFERVESFSFHFLSGSNTCSPEAYQA